MTGDWRDRARCLGTDTEAFFPLTGESTKTALAVCAACPVRTECLNFALSDASTHGIFGGTTRKMREKLRAEMTGRVPTETRKANERARRARIMSAAGCAVHEITKELNVSTKTVGRYLKEPA